MTGRRIIEHRRRRSLANERPIVAHVDPKPAGGGLRLGEHLHGRVVDMQALGGEHVPAKLGEDGVEGGDATADPVSEGRDVEFDALAEKAALWRFSGRWSPNLPTRIMASRLGPAKPRGIGCDGAGGSVIASQSRQANFSRTRSMIFQRRGSHSSVLETTSPSLRSRAPPHLPQAQGRARRCARPADCPEACAGRAARRRRCALAVSGAAISAFVSSSACVSSRSSIASSSCSTRSLPRSDDWPKRSWRALANSSFSRSISRARTCFVCASLSAARWPASRAGRGSSRGRSPGRSEARSAGRRQVVRRARHDANESTFRGKNRPRNGP